MIISPKYGFVFLATQKTASTTIHTVLKKIEDNQIIDKSNDHIDENGYINNYWNGKHINCEAFIEKYPTCKNYFKFAFVRNPWDCVVSWYEFQLRCCQENPNISSDWNLLNVSFENFIHNFQNIWLDPIEWKNLYLFTKCCDFIGRFENLQEDFDFVCDKIGIPKQQLPHENKTKHKSYTEYYNDETKQIVAEVFAKDIEYFGYKFGE
tara:strand:+ start:818 stop:1441 length:624 start_codon:yes stop_codon:yes gene_type:complete